MRNVLVVNLYGEKAHVAVTVEEMKDATFTLTIIVNGTVRFGPKDGFASPPEALDYAARHYTGYPLSGSYVASGRGELDESVATIFVENIEGREAKAFRKFLADLEVEFGIIPANEIEHRTAHAIWVVKGKSLDAVIAINKIRNAV